MTLQPIANPTLMEAAPQMPKLGMHKSVSPALAPIEERPPNAIKPLLKVNSGLEVKEANPRRDLKHVAQGVSSESELGQGVFIQRQSSFQSESAVFGIRAISPMASHHLARGFGEGPALALHDLGGRVVSSSGQGGDVDQLAFLQRRSVRTQRVDAANTRRARDNGQFGRFHEEVARQHRLGIWCKRRVQDLRSCQAFCLVGRFRTLPLRRLDQLARRVSPPLLPLASDRKISKRQLSYCPT
jgi:hypothetical protein